MKAGLINVSGDYVLEPRYKAIFNAMDAGPICVRDLVEDHQAVAGGGHVGGMWRFIDLDGNPAFDREFEPATRFGDGLALVTASGRTEEYIDWSGVTRIKPQVDDAFPFRGGRAKAKVDGRFGIIDTLGEWIHPPTLDHLHDFSCGLAVAGMPGHGFLHGYLNIHGRWAIPPRFRFPGDFSEGLAFATNEDFCGFIDIRGEPVIEFDEPCKSYRFSEGLASVWSSLEDDPLAGYINTCGEMVIPPLFDYGSTFTEGYAAVQVDGKWGFIDRAGRYTVPPVYEDALYGFSHGLARVRENGVYRFVDPGGVPAFDRSFANATSFRNGLARVDVE